ncbi:MAG: hypothetical protein CMH59_23560 [Myxococcales bacterium]|nr:hypothetical protein [Myxococcales bacterium]
MAAGCAACESGSAGSDVAAGVAGQRLPRRERLPIAPAAEHGAEEGPCERAEAGAEAPEERAEEPAQQAPEPRVGGALGVAAARRLLADRAVGRPRVAVQEAPRPLDQVRAVAPGGLRGGVGDRGAGSARGRVANGRRVGAGRRGRIGHGVLLSWKTGRCLGPVYSLLNETNLENRTVKAHEASPRIGYAPPVPQPAPGEEPQIFALVVGRLVAALRERAGLSQAALAERVGLTQPTLSRVERGRAQLDVYAFHRIAEVFGMRPAELHQHVERALARSEEAARGALGEPKTSPARKRPWWEHAAEVGGAAGLGGLVAFAVGAALDEKRRGKKKP